VRIYRLYLEDEDGMEIEAAHELEPGDLDDPERVRQLIDVIRDAIKAHEEAMTG
jgi:KaiC/GvpD/RAD55 family RecA-like ATPase